METSRQQSFTQLKGPCVELSSVGLKFRGNQATSNDVLQALKPVHAVLMTLSGQSALDGKLAEYAFFPLSHIFNETQRISSSCLELAVNCLCILISDGWREGLSPQMGKQLIILLTLIVGGAPSKLHQEPPTNTRPEELAIAGFKCLTATFNVLGGPVAQETIYHEIGSATIVDQTVYVLLEGVVDEHSEELCVSAALALQALYRRITDRVVLASIMPRTVSALTKVLKPTTQVRRSYRLLSICLQVLTDMLKKVLNDKAVEAAPSKLPEKNTEDKIALDESWLKATVSQIKIALANIIQIRRHERSEVQAALLSLCLMVIEDCQNSLKDSVPIVVDTMVVLADLDDNQMPNEAYSALTHTATTYPVVLDSLKNSLHVWITAFPRTMQSNDETSKQWALKQISTAFQILSQIQSGSDILTNSLASGLCDSVSAVLSHTTDSLQPLNTETLGNQSLEVLHLGQQATAFPPILMEHRSQQQTLIDLQSMIVRLNASDIGTDVTRLIINRIHRDNGNAMVAPFWLALTCLKSSTPASSAFDDFISFDQFDSSSSLATRSAMVEELYYIALPILSEPLLDDSRDWRISALALESVALQAQQLGEEFRPELMDALYPVLQLLASSNTNLQRHAMTCLNILTSACNYDSASTMVIENVDYLVNSVGLKLNTFDVSPYPPQVLFMMIKLCGARLIPYLDDLVDSMFSILDLYHGYPKLVEMMFKTLAAVVDEGTKSPSMLAIESRKDYKAINHRKKHYATLEVSALAEDLAKRKAKRAKYDHELDLPDEATETGTSHPKQPWTTPQPDTNTDTPFDPDNLPTDDPSNEEDDALPPPRDPEDQEAPLSKSHTLLLHIVKSIPSHLSSPSPYLRRSLLTILTQVSPVFASHENSFLPLINDVWPAVVSRITIPASLLTSSAPASSSTSLIQTKPDDTFHEDLFVTTAACQTVDALCKSAGDFMATRIEKEFPRWERMYQRVWERVRADAEKALARRAQYQSSSTTQPSSNSSSSPSSSPKSHPNESAFLRSLALSNSLSPSPSPSQSLSTTTTPSNPTATATATSTFTPHHTLWRSLLTLFITLLTHVRLPLATGDQISTFIAAWIARYAGPEYYFSRPSSHKKHSNVIGGAETDAVEAAIDAMETWNADLAWFLFSAERARVERLSTATATDSRFTGQGRGKAVVEVGDGVGKLEVVPGVRFAEVVF